MNPHTLENASAHRGADNALSASLNQPTQPHTRIEARVEAPKSDSVMGTARLEAFSDGVIAVIITIMVLELKAPAVPDIGELFARWHIFASYAASFAFVAIYWVAHHHLMHAARRVTAPTLWLNINWLFWLSLYPFVTNYVSETKGAPLAMACYAAVAAAAAIAFGILARDLRIRNSDGAVLSRGERRSMVKNLASVALQLLAIPAAYVSVPLACLLLAIPPVIHFMPDRTAEQNN